MKVKTSELTNRQLDWAVAKCEGWVTYPTDSIERGDWYHTDAAVAPLGYEHNRIHRDDFNPSSNWSQGGPIIERALLDITPSPYEHREDMRWHCQHYNSLGGYAQYGPTPLVAAMKCYVTSQLGDEVEVPESLL